MTKKVHTCGQFGGTRTLCGIQLIDRVPKGVGLVGKRKLSRGRTSDVKISSWSEDVTCANCWKNGR